MCAYDALPITGNLYGVAFGAVAVFGGAEADGADGSDDSDGSALEAAVVVAEPAEDAAS